MQGKTHRVGGVLCCLAGFTLMESKGLLIQNVSPILQLAVMYPFAIYGSVMPDLDHKWQSAPSKDLVSLVINKLLHLTTGLRQKGISLPILNLFDAKHRSWQTHSDLFLISMIIACVSVLSSSLNSVDLVIFRLMSLGFILGVISHLVLDMLTPEGIWCILTTIPSRVSKSKKIPEKIHLVPKSKLFSTGNEWENFVRSTMWVICFILVIRIIYLLSPYRIDFF